MSKQTKKIVCLILAAVIAVSCFSVSAAAAERPKAAGDDNVGALPPLNVTFTDSQHWGWAFVYAWDEDGNELLGSWPGEMMYEQYTDFYAYTLPYQTYGFIINSGTGEQTIELLDGQTNYYTTGKTDKSGRLIAYPERFEEGYYRVPVVNSINWDEVYVYALDMDGKELEGKWPGRKLDFSDYSDKYGNKRDTYYYQYETEEIIFNNGKGERTVAYTDFRKSDRYDDVYITNQTDNSGYYLLSDSLSEMEYRYGDVDFDRDVTINDVTKLQRYLAEFEDSRFTYIQEALADADGNGSVSITDATAIQYKIAELNDGGRTGKKCPTVLPGGDYCFLYSKPNWKISYIYTEDKDGNPLCGSWPGTLLPRSNTWNGMKEIDTYIPLEAEKVVLSCGNDRTAEAVKFPSTSNWYTMMVGDSQDENGYYSLEPYFYYQEKKDKEIYFLKPYDWEFVNVYAWDANGNAVLGDWPGTPMTRKIHQNAFGDDAANSYSVTIPKEAVGISFNCGADGDRTEDFYNLGSNDTFYTGGKRDDLGHLIVYNDWGYIG